MSSVVNRKGKSSSSKQPLSTQASTSVDESEPNTSSPKPHPILPQRVIARIVMITSLLCIVYYSTKQEKFQTFAKQSESLTGRGQNFDCSEKYRKEVYKYDECFPRNCGRFVSDKIVTPEEAVAMLKIAEKGLALGGSDGGASILDLHSGALSKGQHFIDIYKSKDAKNLFTEADFAIYKTIKQKILHGIQHHFGVRGNKIYLTHPTFFSKMTSRKAVTIHDEYWHPHVDKETYKSFHYTSLLYLNDYNVDFKGGRFIFVDEKVNRTVEPRVGRVSMFTSGSENLHYVEKVTSGVRYAVTISFTCDPNYSIKDPSVEKFTNT